MMLLSNAEFNHIVILNLLIEYKLKILFKWVISKNFRFASFIESRVARELEFD